MSAFPLMDVVGLGIGCLQKCTLTVTAVLLSDVGVVRRNSRKVIKEKVGSASNWSPLQNCATSHDGDP